MTVHVDRRAGGLGPHDLGRVAVSNVIWEKPAALSTTDRERVRLHAYQTERILARSRALAPLARAPAEGPDRLAGRPLRPGGRVLRLLARGLANRAIAERLYISPRTAEHHVQHIYTEIGASTRAAAALFAMDHDLLPGGRSGG